MISGVSQQVNAQADAQRMARRSTGTKTEIAHVTDARHVVKQEFKPETSTGRLQ